MFRSQIKLNDSSGRQFIYCVISIAIISRYSDSVVVVKKIGDRYMMYNDHMYHNQQPISESELCDLLDTCIDVMAFYRRVSSNTAPSFDWPRTHE